MVPNKADENPLSDATVCKPHTSVPAGARVALRKDSCALHTLLPSLRSATDHDDLV
jgi:hypothetical protein